MNLVELLSLARTQNASDLHLSAGLPPMLRVHGDIRSLALPVLDHLQILTMLGECMNERQRQQFDRTSELDFSTTLEGLSRFRVNVFKQQRGVAAVFRAIPMDIKNLTELNAPTVLTELALKPRGLVLVTGPTGSGKSTTLAAMLHHINQHRAGHILTVEDPVEFVHESAQCIVNQREVGTDTHGFAAALRSALREDPDVIMVGEMRDLETIQLALTAAETGHLVLGTLHTASAAKTMDRIIDVFPSEEKNMIRAMLAESLTAVVSQILCKNKAGDGRVAAYEIMLGTPAVRNLVREGKVAQLYSTIQTGQQWGMQTLDQSLALLVKQGQITSAHAREYAKHPENFTDQLPRDAAYNH